MCALIVITKIRTRCSYLIAVAYPEDGESDHVLAPEDVAGVAATRHRDYLAPGQHHGHGHGHVSILDYVIVLSLLLVLSFYYLMVMVMVMVVFMTMF